MALEVNKVAKLATNYHINEGNYIGGQEAQALGVAQTKITASAAVAKGQTLELTADWKVAPASAKSTKFVGIAMNDAAINEEVVVDTEGLMKLLSAGAVAYGDSVVCGADGTVAKLVDTGDVIGKAFTSGTDALVYVKLR